MYEDRVSRGAALLDRVRPGWAAEIACDRLAMDSCDFCILGQLYGNYGNAPGEFFGSPGYPNGDDFSRSHGFTLFTSEDLYFGKLADAWRAAIRERVEVTVKEGALA